MPWMYDQSAFSAMCLGETTCVGYAKTMQLLMSAIDIETISVIIKFREKMCIREASPVNPLGSFYRG